MPCGLCVRAPSSACFLQGASWDGHQAGAGVQPIASLCLAVSHFCKCLGICPLYYTCFTVPSRTRAAGPRGAGLVRLLMVTDRQCVPDQAKAPKRGHTDMFAPRGACSNMRCCTALQVGRNSQAHATVCSAHFTPGDAAQQPPHCHCNTYSLHSSNGSLTSPVLGTSFMVCGMPPLQTPIDMAQRLIGCVRQPTCCCV